MGLLDRLRGALGFRPPLVVRDPDAPFALTQAARGVLAALSPGQGIHVETVGVEGGRAVVVTQGAIQGPPPPALEGLPVTLSDTDLAGLAGRALDFRDGRWAIQVHLELRFQDTPNPDGRLYLTDQVLNRGRPRFFTPGPDLPGLPGRLLAVAGVRQVLLRENTVTVEREPGTPWEAIDPAVDTAVRGWLVLGGRPLDADPEDGPRDPFEDELRAVLADKVLPGVHRDGGDIEVVGFSNGVVLLSMHGACRTCPSSTATLRLGVEKALKDAFPGRIERVEAV